MKYFLLIFLSSCAAVPPGSPHSNNCGMSLGGDFDDFSVGTLDQDNLDSRLNAALSSIGFVTDPDIFDIQDQCQKLVGYKVFTKKDFGFYLDDKPYQISGATWCWNKTIVVGTPATGDWTQSSLVHEIYHVFQNCNTPGTPDRLNDTDHANWERYGIYNAIELARKM